MELLTVLLYRQQPCKSMMASENLMPRFLTLPLVGILAEHIIKLLFQLPAFCRFQLRREHWGEIFQRDFLSLKSHDFVFFLVSDMLHSTSVFSFQSAVLPCYKKETRCSYCGGVFSKNTVSTNVLFRIFLYRHERQNYAEQQKMFCTNQECRHTTLAKTFSFKTTQIQLSLERPYLPYTMISCYIFG